jgi:hypothetical protein
MAITSELQGRIVAAARQLIEEKWASEGNRSLLEKRFLEIEDEACEVADALAREVILLATARQAEVVSKEGAVCCPSCRRVAKPREAERRKVQTRRGEVAWEEPHYYCDRCRKSFFPSVPSVGD